MSEITTPQQEHVFTRVDTMGSSKDSPTASSALPAASVRQEVPHSPLPWSCGPDTENCGGGMNIVRPDGHRVAHTARVVAGKEYISEVEAKANADYIVTACNAYPALLAERDALRDQIAQLREALRNVVAMSYMAWSSGVSGRVPRAPVPRCKGCGVEYGGVHRTNCAMGHAESLLSSLPATGEGR